MVVIKDLYNKKNTDQEIAQFEDRLAIKLPPKYKKFLFETNGGKPESSCFDIPGSGGDSMVDFFYGLNVTESYGDLEKQLEMYSGRIPDSFLPIGTDPGGNIICVGITLPHIDQIHFWDHHDELDRRGLSKMDMSNMYLIAEDIYDFLDKLQPEQE